MASPGCLWSFSRQRALAVDGRCKSFGDGADGTGWGEGVGVLVLERLCDARANGHRVLGVVRGSAVNQDGASNGLTAPNGPSQQRVILQALANAGLSPGEVDVVEGHGTGTRLGDPIEVQALLATYGQGRERPLWLGSVKSNIGHAQAAAGVAGVIKMIMAFRHGVLPRTLHVDEPSRQVDWSAGAVSLLTEQAVWESGGRPRRAGVSGFGVSGTNAHVILEEAPVEDGSLVVGGASNGMLGELDGIDGAGVGADGIAGAGVGADGIAGAAVGVDGAGPGVDEGVGVVFGEGVVLPWVLSGRGVGGLCGQAGRLLECVESGSGAGAGVGVVDVGFSLLGRSVFEDRGVVLGVGGEGLLDGLGVLAGGGVGGGVVRGRAVDGRGAVFLFPGQGSQWEGMAVGLLDSSPVFAGFLAECDEALSLFVDWSVEDVLRRGGGGVPGLDRVDVVQPVLFAVMVGLAGLWRACGVEPSVVVGHSQGEIAAAYIAGGLSLQDAARVVALRSSALAGLAGRGGMVSVALGVGTLEGRLERWDGRVSLAAVNGPSSTVVSGESDALREFLAECENDGVRAREIPVDYASHSRQIEEIRDELLDACGPIKPRSSGVPFYSTVTHGLLDTATLDGEYWYRNLRETVQLERTIAALLKDGHRTFVEVSPHPVLTIGLQETIDDAALHTPEEAIVTGSLRREENDPQRFLHALAETWVRGTNVNWNTLYTGRKPKQIKLPPYAFQRQRYWLEQPTTSTGDAGAFGQSATEHPLLGAVVGLADGGGSLFTGRLSLESHPWLADHAVLGTVLLPGTAFLELALHAGRQMGCEMVRDLALESPLVLGVKGTVALQVSVGEVNESGERPISIYSRPGDVSGEEDISEYEWVRHASGVLQPAVLLDREVEAVVDGRVAVLSGEWPPPGAVPIDVDQLSLEVSRCWWRGRPGGAVGYRWACCCAWWRVAPSRRHPDQYRGAIRRARWYRVRVRAGVSGFAGRVAARGRDLCRGDPSRGG